MEKIDFIELAKYCASVFKEAHTKSGDFYKSTLYVSISEDNEVLCSKTSHVLNNASRCILVHEHAKLAVSNYYSWYKVQYIDENGCVFDGELGDGYTLSVYACGSFSNMWMELHLNNNTLYSCRPPFERQMAKIWKFYQKVKDISSEKEVKTIADLFRKDEKILELEKEIEGFKYENYLLEQQRNEYRDLLDEIKEMVSKQNNE